MRLSRNSDAHSRKRRHAIHYVLPNPPNILYNRFLWTSPTYSRTRALHRSVHNRPPFFHLLAALREFCSRPPHSLPLSAALPDMKARHQELRPHPEALQDAGGEREGRIQGDPAAVWRECGPRDGLMTSLRIVTDSGSSEGSGGVPSMRIQLRWQVRCLRRLSRRRHIWRLSAVSALLEQTPQKAITNEAVTAHVLNLLPKGTELPSEVEQAISEV